MNKSRLVDLLSAIARRTNEKQLIIVGSQSLHGQCSMVVSSVTKSLEVDVLISPREATHVVIDEEFGPDSAYHLEQGVYADALGLGIVSLPPGWRERLVEIRDEETDFSYLALEKHDTAVAKLIAGREKDYAFLAELLSAGVIEMAMLMDRMRLMRDSAYAQAVVPRLTKLLEVLRTHGLAAMSGPVETLIRDCG